MSAISYPNWQTARVYIKNKQKKGQTWHSNMLVSTPQLGVNWGLTSHTSFLTQFSRLRHIKSEILSSCRFESSGTAAVWLYWLIIKKILNHGVKITTLGATHMLYLLRISNSISRHRLLQSFQVLFSLTRTARQQCAYKRVCVQGND